MELEDDEGERAAEEYREDAGYTEDESVEVETRDDADSDVEKGVGGMEGEADVDAEEKREGEMEADGPWPLLRMGKRRSVLLPEDISSDMMGAVMVLYGALVY